MRPLLPFSSRSLRHTLPMFSLQVGVQSRQPAALTPHEPYSLTWLGRRKQAVAMLALLCHSAVHLKRACPKTQDTLDINTAQSLTQEIQP